MFAMSIHYVSVYIERAGTRWQRLFFILVAFFLLIICPTHAYARTPFGGFRSTANLAYRSSKRSDESSSSVYSFRLSPTLEDSKSTTSETAPMPASPSVVSPPRGRYVVTERSKYDTYWRRASVTAATPLLLTATTASASEAHSDRVARTSPAYQTETVREVHVINEAYVLLYVVAEKETQRDRHGDAERNDVLEVAPLEIIDLSTSPSLARLKLSEALQPPPAASSKVDSRHFTPLDPLPAASPTWHAVGVYTAMHEAVHVLEALQTDPRYVRAMRADPACYVSLSQASVMGDSLLSLRIAAIHHAGEEVATAEEAEAWTYQRACQAVLQLVARLPTVRWMEPLPVHAALLNDMASSILQSSYTEEECETRSHVLLDNLKLDGNGEIIAIADSGVDVYSCYFYDANHEVAYYPNTSREHRKIVSVHGCDFVPGEVDVTDEASGHGTHVAGTALGAVSTDTTASEDYKNAARYNGVAPAAKLFLRDMGQRSSRELVLPNQIQDIFRSAYTTGARISSNSWGLNSHDSYAAIEKLVDAYAYAHDDLLLLFAAGNTGRRNLYAPGRAKNVLTVGSHGNACASRNTVSTHSSYGPTYDGRRKPEVVGPGERVVSALAASPTNTAPHCGTATKGGTSMATGAMAGAAALLRQYLREEVHLSSPSSALLRGALMHSTMRLAPATADHSGFGRVDLSLLLYRPQHTFQKKVWMADRERVGHRATRTYCFSSLTPEAARAQAKAGGTDGQELLYIKATLAWTDVGSAMEGSGKSLVHDLDLVIIDREGKRYYPHATSATDVFYDRVNTAEQIRMPISAPLAAGFRVMVYGADVADPSGQLYSVIVSAPGLVPDDTCRTVKRQQDSNSSAAVFTACPLNCSGHGQCAPATGMCTCDKGFAGVDCAVCDAEELCHHNGVCATDAAGRASCTCHSSGHFSDAWCSTCATGWYGPRCDSTCACRNGSTCDVVTGLCQCAQDWRLGGLGCFTGPACEYCCEGRGGARCNVRSYWCNVTGSTVEVTDPQGGYIQVNGYELYHYSALCRWSIQAPSPSYTILLEYLWLDIESPYDTLTLYDPLSPRPSHKVRTDSGIRNESWAVRSLGPTLELVFTSDWEQVRRGFLIHYTFVPVRPTRSRQKVCAAALRQNIQLSGGGNWGVLTKVLDLEGEDFLCTCGIPTFGFNCQSTLANSRLGQRCAALFPSTTTDALAQQVMCAAQKGESVTISTAVELSSQTACAPPVVHAFPLVINSASLLRVTFPSQIAGHDGRSDRVSRIALVLHLLPPSLPAPPSGPNLTLYVKSALLNTPPDSTYGCNGTAFPLTLGRREYEKDAPAELLPIVILVDLSRASSSLPCENTTTTETLLLDVRLLTNFTERTTYSPVLVDATVSAAVLPPTSASTNTLDSGAGDSRNSCDAERCAAVRISALSATDADASVAALARQWSSVLRGTVVTNPQREDAILTSRRAVGHFTFAFVVCVCAVVGAFLGYSTSLLSQIHQRDPNRHVTFYVGREEMRPDEEEMNVIGGDGKANAKRLVKD